MKGALKNVSAATTTHLMAELSSSLQTRLSSCPGNVKHAVASGYLRAWSTMNPTANNLTRSLPINPKETPEFVRYYFRAHKESQMNEKVGLYIQELGRT